MWIISCFQKIFSLYLEIFPVLSFSFFCERKKNILDHICNSSCFPPSCLLLSVKLFQGQITAKGNCLTRFFVGMDHGNLRRGKLGSLKANVFYVKKKLRHIMAIKSWPKWKNAIYWSSIAFAFHGFHITCRRTEMIFLPSIDIYFLEGDNLTYLMIQM